MSFIVSLLCALLFLSTLQSVFPAPYYNWKVIETYPHDTNAFTEGLLYQNGFFYESTGLQGSSTVRKVEVTTGKVISSHSLDDTYFGEGLTNWASTLIQLTWQSQIGFVYDTETFTVLKNFSYSGEGWGLTHDDKYLIRSDGTHTLYFWDPVTFTQVKTLDVQEDSQPISLLNELEYINGVIFANVWLSWKIVMIDPANGQVIGWLNVTKIIDNAPDVLNGIAYDAQNDRLFITGKDWGKMFHIQIEKSFN